MAAVLFNHLREKKSAEYFSRMSVASHGPERDTGHTGNFFNMFWAIPGVALSGPNATGAWMKEFGSWYFDLARCWDGTFRHQGAPATRPDAYRNWDCTGAYLLAYAMPLRKIHLTGKRPSVVSRLDASAVQALIRDGHGWSNKDRNSAYDAMSPEALLTRLDSWSPTVRERAAMALARRKADVVPALIENLEASRLESRYGACQALACLKEAAAPAVPALKKAFSDEDLWLRVKAAEALAGIGQPAMSAVPALLERLAKDPSPEDPRGMEQRYLCFALFDRRRGMLGRSLEGVDREALYAAVRAGLHNQDGRARGCIGSVYGNLPFEQIKPLLPAIHEAIVKPAPSGIMFCDGIRTSGLELFVKHRISEGIELLADYARNQKQHASEKRIGKVMDLLKQYGTHARRVIPRLKAVADYFEKEEKDFPRKLSLEKAKVVRETIASIEAATDTPALIRLNR
jgi:hypothetical protein